MLKASLSARQELAESEASIEAWLKSFHEWVDGYSRCAPLPESATSRAAFYSEEGV